MYIKYIINTITITITYDNSRINKFQYYDFIESINIFVSFFLRSAFRVQIYTYYFTDCVFLAFSVETLFCDLNHIEEWVDKNGNVSSER